MAQYPLASSDHERQRLRMQSEALRPLTERMLTGAGIRADARVLPTGQFDAVVGRYILMYLRDPEATIERPAGWLRAGGALAFLEMDSFRGVRSRVWPPLAPKTMQAIEFIGDVMLDVGIHADMAVRLPSALSRYGDVNAEVSAPLQFGAASVALPLAAVRSVVPVARRLGRADADQHDADALLAEEMAARDEHTVTIPPLSVAEWVRV